MPAVIDKIKEGMHISEGNKGQTSNAAASSTTSGKRAFDDSKVTVIFVLGGPGAGNTCYCM